MDLDKMTRKELVKELEKRGHICFFFHKEDMMRRVLGQLIEAEKNESAEK